MNSSILPRLAALLLNMKGRRIEKGRQDVTEGEREDRRREEGEGRRDYLEQNKSESLVRRRDLHQ